METEKESRLQDDLEHLSEHPVWTPWVDVQDEDRAVLDGRFNRAQVERVLEEMGGGWISVEDKERLPEEGEMVCITDGAYRWAGYLMEGIWRLVEPGYERPRMKTILGGGITHWQPLPKPPED